MKKSILTKVLGAVVSASMLLTPITAFAEPVTGTNISSQTIPVTASIDTYYEISTPAGLTGNVLQLTREYNDFIKTTGDTNSTFYGHTSIGVRGSVYSTKKIVCNLTCADLTRTVALPDAADNTAPVGMTNITSAQNTKVTAIWSGSGNTTAGGNNLAFVPSNWTAGTTGLTGEFASSEVQVDTQTYKYYMLRTTLPKDGTYNSNLIINFALNDATP